MSVSASVCLPLYRSSGFTAACILEGDEVHLLPWSVVEDSYLDVLRHSEELACLLARSATRRGGVSPLQTV